MRRAKQLGSVTFDMNTLFIREEMENSKVLAEMHMTAAGSHVVYETQIVTPYITLDSKRYGWINDEQREAILEMWETPGATYTLTYDDDTTVEVRPAREKKLSITPLYEGACYYTAVIPLAKV